MVRAFVCPVVQLYLESFDFQYLSNNSIYILVVFNIQLLLRYVQRIRIIGD